MKTALLTFGLASGLLCVAACDDGPEPPDSAVDGGVDAGVDAGDAALPTGPVTTNYEGDRPPRDGFCDVGADAQPLDALPMTTIIDTRTSLVDHARPSTDCAVSSAAITPDLVFSFTPPERGIFTMRADLPGTDPWVDTILYVRLGCDGAGAELACNDDASSTSGPSRLSVEVAAGEPLFAIIDGFAPADAGRVEVSFDFVPMPISSGAGGDTCEEATELRFSGEGDTLIAIAMGDTDGASNAGGCDDVPATRDLPDQFHAFTIPDVRDVLIRVAPDDDYDPAFYVLRACDDSAAVACHDTGPPGFTEALTLEALPAGRYVIGVDAFEHPRATYYEQGPYVLEVVATTP